MITDPKHPVAQNIFDRIRSDHVKNIKEEEDVVKELFICPSFEDALCVRCVSNGVWAYQIERNSFNVINSRKITDDASDVIELLSGKASSEISAQLDGTIVFLRVVGLGSEYLYINSSDALDELKSICDSAGKDYKWIKEDLSLRGEK